MLILLRKKKMKCFFFVCEAPYLLLESPVLILGLTYVCVCVWMLMWACEQARVRLVSQAKYPSQFYVWDYGITATSYIRALQPTALSLIPLVTWIKTHRGPTKLAEEAKCCMLGISQCPVQAETSAPSYEFV